MPVRETTPAGTARPCRWVSRSMSPRVAPPWTRTVRRRRVDDDGAHLGEVDHQAVVAERPAGDVVAAAAHRDEDVVGAGEVDGGDHVGRVAAADDQAGVAVDRGVPDPAGGVVVGVARAMARPARPAAKASMAASATAAPLRFRSAVMALPPWSPTVRAPVGEMLPRPAGIRMSAGGDQEEPREGQEQGAVLEGRIGLGDGVAVAGEEGLGLGRRRAGRGTGAGRCCVASRPRRRGRRAGGGSWCARRRRRARGASAGGSTSRRRGGRRGRPRRREPVTPVGVGGGLAHQPVGRLVEVVGHLHREAAAGGEPGHQRREEGLRGRAATAARRWRG